MLLSDEELDDLAAFFSKRLPPPDGELGQPVAAWRSTLSLAARSGQLTALIDESAAIFPADANFANLKELLGTPRADLSPWFGVALGGAGAFAVAVAVTLLGVGAFLADLPALQPGSIAPQELAQAEDNEVVTVDDALQPQDVDAAEDITPQDATLAAATPTPRPPQPSSGPIEIGPRSIAHRITRSQRQAMTPSPEHCSRPDGGLVGYWFAGKDAPGKRGDLVVLTGARYVRLDYPDHANHYDVGAAVQCVIYKGDVIKLPQDPMRVPGDYYWVPLHAADIVGKAPVSLAQNL